MEINFLVSPLRPHPSKHGWLRLATDFLFGCHSAHCEWIQIDSNADTLISSSRLMFWQCASNAAAHNDIISIDIHVMCMSLFKWNLKWKDVWNLKTKPLKSRLVIAGVGRMLDTRPMRCVMGSKHFKNVNTSINSHSHNGHSMPRMYVIKWHYNATPAQCRDPWANMKEFSMKSNGDRVSMPYTMYAYFHMLFSS